MSIASILAACGMTAQDVRRIASKNDKRGLTVAQRNELKYNPDAIADEDDAKNRQEDAEREADSFAQADYGMVSNSNWQLNTRIGG